MEKAFKMTLDLSAQLRKEYLIPDPLRKSCDPRFLGKGTRTLEVVRRSLIMGRKK